MELSTIENDSSPELSRIDDADQVLLFVEGHKSPHQLVEASPTIVTAQLSGTFLQDSQSLRSGNRHILCYRRNLFQIRGTIIFDGGSFRSLFSPSSHNKLIELRVILTARENLNGNQVAIITVPKITKEGISPTRSIIPEPISLKIDNSSGNTKPIAFSWPRLQFRTATAKSGRRKERGLEQHFEILINVLAVFQDYTETLLSEKKSVPIIVRGRSPGNFSSITKMSPDNGEHPTHTPEPRNDGVGEVPSNLDLLPQSTEAEMNTHTSYFTRGNLIYPDEMDAYDTTFSFAHACGDQIMSNPAFLTQDFHTSNHLISPPPNVILGDNDSLDIAVGDCLCGDDPAQTSEHAPFTMVTSTLSKPSTPLNDFQFDQETEAGTIKSGLETRSSFQYEYIPLSLDDRTPPVQAIYQPHGAHHKITLPKTRQGNNKRYFGEFSD